MRTFILILILASISLTIKRTDADAVDVKTLEPYVFEGPQGQKVNAFKGAFKVPENRSIPDSRTITLTYVVFPATTKTPGNPIVYLAGGPGGSATGTAKGQRFPLFQRMRDVSDVILFDQRGTGLSNQLASCDAGPKMAPSNQLSQPSVVEFYKTKIAVCRKEWDAKGFDLNGYNTKESAQDLVELSRSLGVEKLNLWGISYGTHLALATAKYHPKVIDRMVLASTEGLEQTIKLPRYSDALLKRIDELVQSDEASHAKYPNWLNDLDALLVKLEKQSVTVAASHPETKQSFEVVISKLDVQMILSYMMLKNPDTIARVPQMITAMNNGVYEPFAMYFAGLKRYLNTLNPMSLAMDASSGIDKVRWQQVLKQSQTATLDRVSNFPYPDISPFLEVQDLGSGFRNSFNALTPTLFFAGTLDGRTYIEEQKLVAEQFENKSFVTLVNAGHDLFMLTPRVGDLMKQFFSGEKVETQTIDLPAPKFF